MYLNKKILVGKNENFEANLLLNKANRHGLITGASGSGKTVTLKVLAESFSATGVPVFMCDIKGDLSATSEAGISNDNITSRIETLKLENFDLKAFPVTYLDIYGENGHPIRTTVEKLGPKLLSRMLNLTDAQEGVLTIAFKIAEDEGLSLIDLKDLRAVLNYVGEKRQEYSLNYGNITTQSIGSIQRNILTLQEEGADNFFGEPSFDLSDLIHHEAYTNNGFINILHSVKLIQHPMLYATFLLWLLNEIYDTMPEVGDLDKPKLILFFDEAHLMFSEMPDHIIKKVIQIVKLIRSKGVGLYFISQSPSDIPDEILAQLGNRIQHVLRSYTKTDEKTIKAAADSYRANPNFKTDEVIKTLATGEALVSFQNEFGEPSIVEKVTILPPQSKMGVIDEIKRQNNIKSSWIYFKYKDKKISTATIDAINKKMTDKKDAEEKAKQEQLEEKLQIKKEAEKQKEQQKKKQKGEKQLERFENKIIDSLGKNIGKKITRFFK